MATIKETIRKSYLAAADLTAARHHFVVVDVSEETIALPGSGGGGVLAFALMDDPDNGEYGSVAVAGIAKVTAGAAIDAMDEITCNDDGEAEPVGSGDVRCGIALHAAASGDVVQFLIAL